MPRTTHVLQQKRVDIDGVQSWCVTWGNKTLDVEGPYMKLGLGGGRFKTIPPWGIRRVMWDICFGYVSGFPKRAILYYVLTRSLNRHIFEHFVDQKERMINAKL